MTTQNIFDLVDTWALSGGPYTSIKMNATDNDAASASLLMDLQVGTVSQFKVSKAGVTNVRGDILPFADNGINIGSGALRINTVTVATAFRLTSAGAFDWSDTFLTRRAAANLRLGAADTTGTTAPTAQFLSVQSWASSTNNNQTGANFTIDGSQGTGQGAGGSIIFRVAPAGGTSNGVQNALSAALTIGNDRVVTVAANASSLAQIAMADRGTVLSIYATAFGVQPLLVSAPGGIAIYNDTGSLSLGASSDVKLFRDAANTLALRNGTAAQLFRVYRTTDGTNASWLEMDANANGNAYIGTNKTGTGTAGPLYFLTGGTARWQVTTSGNFTADTDNTYDIGASGANRPRDIYLGGKIVTASVQAVSAGNGVVFRNNVATGIAQIDSNGSLNACYNTTLPAGGTAGRGLMFSSNITNMGVFFGSGAPTLSAAKGSLYLRSDGTTVNDRMYVNTDGSTTWTPVTTTA